MRGFPALGFVGLAALIMLAGCDLHRRSKLSQTEAKACLVKGGHESRAPFGAPICQVPYADAGKSCTGKSDCSGACLSDAPDNAGTIAVGTPVTGRCEAESETFGCYAKVENGKLAERYTCWD